MRFIADAMLGRLARWLRLLGFDTLYFADIDDGELMKLARKEDRLILTRDSQMNKKDIPGLLLIRSDDAMEQALQVVGDLMLRLPAEGRCANCNGLLEDVRDREDIRDFVPDYVFHAFHRFRRCSICGKVYWEGTQYRRFKERVEEIARAASG